MLFFILIGFFIKLELDNTSRHPISKFSGSHCTMSSSNFRVFWFSLYFVVFLFQSCLVLSVLCRLPISCFLVLSVLCRLLISCFLVLSVLCRLPISQFSGSHCTVSSSYFKVSCFSLEFVVFLFQSCLVLSVLCLLPISCFLVLSVLCLLPIS